MRQLLGAKPKKTARNRRASVVRVPPEEPNAHPAERKRERVRVRYVIRLLLFQRVTFHTPHSHHWESLCFIYVLRCRCAICFFFYYTAAIPLGFSPSQWLFLAPVSVERNGESHCPFSFLRAVLNYQKLPKIVFSLILSYNLCLSIIIYNINKYTS